MTGQLDPTLSAELDHTLTSRAGSLVWHRHHDWAHVLTASADWGAYVLTIARWLDPYADWGWSWTVYHHQHPIASHETPACSAEEAMTTCELATAIDAANHPRIGQRVQVRAGVHARGALVGGCIGRVTAIHRSRDLIEIGHLDPEHPPLWLHPDAVTILRGPPHG